ncbi:bZIP transcription factor [Pseudolysinimonas sp.]
MSDPNLTSFPRAERMLRRTEFSTARLALIGTAIGLGSTLLTGVVTLTPTLTTLGDRDARIAELESEASELRVENAAAEITIEGLREENRELRAALPQTVDPAEVPLLRLTRGGVVLSTDFHIDLASVTPDLGQSQYGTAGDDLSFDGKNLQFGFGGVSWVRTDGVVASYESCAYLTGWRQDRKLDAASLRSTDVCLRLGSGRIASIVVTDIQNDAVTFTVTVWDDSV